MKKPSLESLALRVEALERAVGLGKPAHKGKDWRRGVGMLGDSDFMKAVDAAGQAIREAERKEAAQAERSS